MYAAVIEGDGYEAGDGYDVGVCLIDWVAGWAAK